MILNSTNSTPDSTIPPRLIIGISGASGAIYGVRLLQLLSDSGIETHLIVSRTAQITLATETPYKLEEVHKLATHVHSPADMAATVSSGSFQTMGMVIAPCSVKTLAEIATGVTTGLIARAADVILKERRRLVLMVRETPLHSIHLRNMLTLSEMGAILAPPLPAFYNNPQTIDDLVTHSAGRVLDLFNLSAPAVKRWQGL